MKVTIDKVKQAYKKAKDTGMFWEFHPEMTGEWQKDKDDYIEFVEEHWNWNLIDESS